ncbi:MAG TPA: penicillin-insensitive murein endopeptidase [Kofleriaceae bacterium]|nr:penicillin-insensitive murein endopeptidase [Kofleriaceae bacterium]
MRRAALLASLLASGGGCAELGVVSDGTSISVGRPSRGRVLDGARMPDTGEGFVTRETWRTRGNRFGTDELVDLLTGVARRSLPKNDGIRLVVADLSSSGGGAALKWHRSHQNGRDVDLLYYVKDKDGKAVENDAMHVFRADLTAADGSGMTVDIPRLWNLVRELLTAPEAPVQWVFMYQPIANALVEHAIQLGEPEVLIERARKACKQPGDSAPHHDHIHVRVYCAPSDRAFGCVDIGPMELLAEREGELAAEGRRVAETFAPAPRTFTEAAIAEMPAAAAPVPAPSVRAADSSSIRRLLRAGAHRLQRWRGR